MNDLCDKFNYFQICRTFITRYDILGKEVITLINKAQEPGYKSIVWNGTDQLGQNVGSGVYSYTLHSGDFIQTKKLMLIK